ncbi:MAG TPA: metallophosphoesterase [Herpetosiphon sp.]|uniref:Metallophosphoesterase n=1 Tax=Herpetosiphon aurantiacus (strain ATCC 23779 / DSM 785 / 114-95) TaxID=316274 RepID=A9B699_HERA2|nr:metallophosphoesterase family protein [Herpetosiphon sp.]ABX06310.1 metallophosphoesterase [Herpetosiphon aurantiacus DSM 785]HBW48890.1 metallophosphoesterase [Herpetosiphon sp.]
MPRWALLADVHGNRLALAAVLADLAQRHVDQIINLGDSVYSVLQPRWCAEQLAQIANISISGNQDRILFEQIPVEQQTLSYRFVQADLGPNERNWLTNQPATAIVDDIFCCHGTPSSDTTYLLEHVTPHGVLLHSEETIRAAIQGISQSLIVCGHSHIARTVQLSNGQLIVNPGSVGIPAYNDDQPYPHIIEAGSPHARYAIVERNAQSWQVEHFTLGYAWQQAAATAQHNGRDNLARWLQTGRAKLDD